MPSLRYVLLEHAYLEGDAYIIVENMIGRARQNIVRQSGHELPRDVLNHL